MSVQRDIAKKSALLKAERKSKRTVAVFGTVMFLVIAFALMVRPSSARKKKAKATSTISRVTNSSLSATNRFTLTPIHATRRLTIRPTSRIRAKKRKGQTAPTKAAPAPMENRMRKAAPPMNLPTRPRAQTPLAPAPIHPQAPTTPPVRLTTLATQAPQAMQASTPSAQPRPTVSSPIRVTTPRIPPNPSRPSSRTQKARSLLR